MIALRRVMLLGVVTAAVASGPAYGSSTPLAAPHGAPTPGEVECKGTVECKVLKWFCTHPLSSGYQYGETIREILGVEVVKGKCQTKD